MVDPQQLPGGQTDVRLREYLAVIRRRRLGILLTAVLVVAGALAYSFSSTPIYQSKASVHVKPIVVSSTDIAGGTPPNMDTERRLSESSAVASIAAEGLSGVSIDDLLENLTTSIETNTEILVFEFTSQDPTEASEGAQAFADAYLEYRRQQAVDALLAASASLQSRIETLNARLDAIDAEIALTKDETERETLRTEGDLIAGQVLVLQQKIAELAPPETLGVGDVIEPAQTPREPAFPNHVLNGGLALVVGLVVGTGLGFLRDRLLDVVKSRLDLATAARAPVWSLIPRVAAWAKSDQPSLITADEPDSAVSEAYRTLRTAVLFAATQKSLKTLMITSAHQHEGKTTITANLAVTLAQAGRKVVIVSADLRKPRLHHLFALTRGRGLVDLLVGDSKLDDVLIKDWMKGLSILPSGGVPGNPAELLGSNGMRELLEQLADDFEFVLIDAAPLLAVTDAAILGSFVDGVVLVTDAGKTTRSAVRQAREQLDQIQATVAGAVLNNVDASSGAAGYYGHYYTYKEAEEKPGRIRQALRWLRPKPDPGDFGSPN